MIAIIVDIVFILAGLVLSFNPPTMMLNSVLQYTGGVLWGVMLGRDIYTKRLRKEDEQNGNTRTSG